MKPLREHLPLMLVLLLMLGAGLLAASVRHVPIAYSGLYVDALASFWMLAILLGTALRLWLWPSTARRWLSVAITAVCMLSCVLAWPILFAGAALLLFFLENERWWLPQRAMRPFSWSAFWAQWQSITALVALFVAMALLTLGGARRFDAANAGAAFTSMVFWLVLLGLGLAVLGGKGRGSMMRAGSSSFLWLYLLARLYTLGPWLSDWSLAALTLGTTLLVWNVLVRPQWLALMSSLVLIALGLGTSAGIAAACFAILAMLLPMAPPNHPINSPPHIHTILLPFTISFVAFWSVIAATMASGISILAGVLWLGMLVLILYSALQSQTWPDPRIMAVSVMLALLSPGMYVLLIQPVVEQLQGGLTSYGTLTSWPWVGLAVANSGNRGVAALPLLSLAGLLIVLMSGLHLLLTRQQEHIGTANHEIEKHNSRVVEDNVESGIENRGDFEQSQGHTQTGFTSEIAMQRTVEPESQPSTFISTILALRNEVPWLCTLRSRRGPYEPR